MEQDIKERMAIGEALSVTFTYIGYDNAKRGDCFVGGGGGLYHWAWDKPTETKHHLYRATENQSI